VVDPNPATLVEDQSAMTLFDHTSVQLLRTSDDSIELTVRRSIADSL
jgi:sarcosine oxidase gamma subunit